MKLHKQSIRLFCLLALVQVSLAYSRKRVESFPSCVEIINIDPPPYSVVKTHKDKSIWFEIAFSKPVFLNHGGEKRVYISTSAAGIKDGTKGISSQQRTADVVQMLSTSHLKWAVKFTLIKPFRNFFGKAYKTFYLVIDGGVFYSRDYVTSKFLHPIFVPLSIYGEYYTHHSEKRYRGNKSIQPLSPALHCHPEPARGIGAPETAVVDKFISIQIPESGHQMATDTDNPTTLHLLALVNATDGKGTTSLPPSVTAFIGGVKYNVELPAWNLTFDVPSTKLRTKFTQKLVYDLVERVYLSQKRNYIQSFEDPLLITSKLKSDGRAFAQPSVHSSDSLVEVYDGSTNVKLLEFSKNSIWSERTKTAPFYINPPFPPSKSRTTKQFIKNNVKQCPPNSARNLGRMGTLYHTIEYGRLYQVVTLNDPKHWTVYRANGNHEKSPPMHVTATTSKGEKIDLSKEARFGWKNKGISSRLVKALTQDYVCLQVIPTESTWNKFTTGEGCIFVPRSVAESRQCGGLKLYENISGIISDPHFCDKKIGDCIGESFSSPKRFPVIPPFGAPELAGRGLKINHSLCLITAFLSPAGLGLIKPRRYSGGPIPALRLNEFETWGSKDTYRYMFTYQFSHLYRLDIHRIPIRGATVQFPHVEYKNHDFCKTVWKFESSDSLSSAYLTAYIHNSGQGGGSFVVRVNCSSLLHVFPSSPVTLWIEKASVSEIVFHLTASSHKTVAKHKCKMNIEIETAKQFSSKIQQFPECTKSITTYHGKLKDPCHLKEESLPSVDMKYYVLPIHQMDPLAHDKHVQERASLSEERKFSLIKAITISLSVPDFQHDLISNLKQLHVYCGRSEVLMTRSYGEFLVYQATGGNSDTKTPKPSLVFTGNDIELSTVYFFLPTRDPESTEEPVYTDCWAELWANRPHPLCDQPILLSYVAIPLLDHDQAVFEGKQSRLSVVYGSISSAVRALLVGCVVMTVIFCVFGGTLHGILLLLKKRLPRTSTLKKYQKDLENVTKADMEYWENPQMFLTSGEHGPFYKLHSFKATDALDTEDIKGLKVAGTLRYESKELQVLFGHVKKVHLDKANRDVWIQASSGMYQLSPDGVAQEYRDEYSSLMKRHGIKIKDSDFS